MLKIINISNKKDELVNMLKSRNSDISEELIPKIREILEDIKKNGDEAVAKYTARFDWSEASSDKIKVTQEEIDEAYNAVGKEFIDTIKISVDRVKKFHLKQKQNSWLDTEEQGVMLGQLTRALDTVGLYVPGGKAAYPSTVIMTAVPAKSAGVKNLIITTPPGKDGKVNPAILAAANEAGVDMIYKVGGAQAIGAMAYGTQTIPQVDKIVGPGNIFVTLAKKLVYGTVDIDMIAGPSEILVIADNSAIPEYVAADLLSQAEHDEMASSILLTVSEKLAEEVNACIEKQIKELPRKEIVEKSLANFGCIALCKDIAEAIETANLVAPEHLELCIEEPNKYLGLIRNAGAIFVGNYSPEPIGDYIAGPSHVLPTAGTARFYSPLSVDHFMKKTSLIWFDEKSMHSLANHVIRFAEKEEFQAHANSLKVRVRNDKES
ncbi:MAG: histidinol dehydrogenase [Deltaproteobacteria bacterium]